MRNLILVLCTVQLLFSSPSSDYTRGLELFQSQAYLKSFIAFEKAFEKDIQNPSISFYMARCLFELEDYEGAMIAFQRVLILDETHLRSRLELARVYTKLQMYSQAKEELLYARSMHPPSQVRINIEKLLHSLQKAQKNSFWTLYLSLRSGYDSNINSNPGEDTLKEYLSTTYGLNKNGILASDVISSGFTQEIMNIGHRYNIVKFPFFIESSFLFYAQQFHRNNDYNIVLTGITTALGAVYNGYRITLPLHYSRLYYGSETLFDTHYIQMKMEKQVAKNTLMHSSFKYGQNKYDSVENKLRDTNIEEFELGFNHAMATHIFGLTYTRTQEHKNESQAPVYIDKDIARHRATYRKKVYNDLELYAEYAFVATKYKDTTPDGIERKDSYNSYFVSVSKKINKTLSVSTGYKLLNNNSNYSPVQYNKETYTLSVNIGF